ncbi:uncharacterized protein MONOS_15400 [Monocercomonoides exilis]|uniref:uncharacterized protein n=1 Tax=Monocercomonoides exilis TaxID=2049356 RepID=UPI00355A173A|nr:hypothetical protein MONOS_15400 [Monocercomonoides exilis]|eukprot:MONOS_15400.1-p1 / transcript=MONOS_15400.1 / gene=MONOS_15400 / organism=Monocercomonoides_exilis_PA203 / gene_product=unspecified product / transcript_product=unspecified product / location=Mono_scaffold01221:10940-11505(-) / protein_length=114 / sequence_SO=supercontig / SO=protein_coding / is_pseudo=false
MNKSLEEIHKATSLAALFSICNALDTLGSGGCEAGDGEEVFGVSHEAARDPVRRADFEADERAEGAAEGEGIDHPDVKEKDSGDEREEQCRDKGAAGADCGDEEEDGAYEFFD